MKLHEFIKSWNILPWPASLALSSSSDSAKAWERKMEMCLRKKLCELDRQNRFSSFFQTENQCNISVGLWLFDDFKDLKIEGWREHNISTPLFQWPGENLLASGNRKKKPNAMGMENPLLLTGGDFEFYCLQLKNPVGIREILMPFPVEMRFQCSFSQTFWRIFFIASSSSSELSLYCCSFKRSLSFRISSAVMEEMRSRSYVTVPYCSKTK